MKNDGLFHNQIFNKVSKIWLFPSGTPPLLLKKGQTLIEAAVAISVALVLISSVVALINATNRRSTLTRQANQASKLAQEGMEIVRNIRDLNDSTAVQVLSSGSCSQTTPCAWVSLYDINLTDPTSTHLSFVGSKWLLLSGDPGASDADAALLGLFKRVVEISDGDLVPTPTPACPGSDLDYRDSKQITVTVFWNSPIGSQQRRMVSCLTNWQQK